MKKAAIGIIFSEDCTQVLLVKRRDVPVWVLPGGGIDEGETAEHAACREVFEETAITVRLVRKIGTYLPINQLAQETHLFECTPVTTISHPLAAQEETLGAAFFPISQLPTALFFLHKEWIDDALHHYPEPIIRKMTSITWWKLFQTALRHPLIIARYLLSRLGLPINSKSDYDLE